MKNNFYFNNIFSVKFNPAIYIVSTYLLVLSIITTLYFAVLEYPIFQLIGLTISRGGTTILMIIFLPIFFLTHYLSTLIFKKIFQSAFQIITEKDKLVIKNKNKNYLIYFNQLNQVLLKKIGKKTVSIKIITTNNKYFFLNFFSDDKLMNNLFLELKNILPKNSFDYKSKKTEKKDVTSTLSCLYKKNFPPKFKTPISQIKVAAIILIFFSLKLIIIFMLFNTDSTNLVNGEQIGTSNYVKENDKTYFLKIGDGYFELKNVNPKKFSPFEYYGSNSKSEYRTEMGFDDNNIFSENTVIEGIKKSEAKYLGKNYIKDSTKVFYKTFQIMNVDPATFKSLYHSILPNAKNFSFGKDKHHVFYQKNILPNADPNTIESIGRSIDYVKDTKNVYYKSEILKNFIPQKTEVKKLKYNLWLAFDGKHFAINSNTFPKKIQHILFGTKNININQLQLLQTPIKEYTTILFSDLNGVYYFDDYKETFYIANNISNLKHYNESLFTDDEYIFYTELKRLGTRKYGNYGNATYIYKSPIPVKKVLKQYSDENITLYKYNNKTYIEVKESIHIIYEPIFRLVVNEQAINNAIKNNSTNEIKRNWLTRIPNSQKINTIRIKFRQ